MRTTLTIDDQLVAELKQVAHESGKSFKQVVNDALRAGLQPAGSGGLRYRLKPASMGKPNPGFNLNKALELADSLEDEALAPTAGGSRRPRLPIKPLATSMNGCVIHW